MNARCLVAVLTAISLIMSDGQPAQAGLIANILRICTRNQVEEINRGMAGQLLDFTENHRVDRRIYCPSLGSKRDVYVYLPPGYDGTTQFPLMIWMHGFGQDERNFLEMIPVFDRAVQCGLLPPMIIVAPDGSIQGRPSLIVTGSFYMNSKAGCFEDYIMKDIWNFAFTQFQVRPERNAHILAGASMGGYAAYHLGFKHREKVGVLIGILPALDIRYADCHDNYMSNYDPNCHAYRTTMRPYRVIAKYYGGLIRVRERRVTGPTVGRRNPQGMNFYSTQNPVELLDSLEIMPGEFEMFLGYSGQDEFNLDAQAEHFIDKAGRRGIYPTVAKLPEGRHDRLSGSKFLRFLAPWVSARVQQYAPPDYALLPPCGVCEGLLTRSPNLRLFQRDPGVPYLIQSPGLASPLPPMGNTLLP